jgi:hypothetical protein
MPALEVITRPAASAARTRTLRGAGDDSFIHRASRTRLRLATMMMSLQGATDLAIIRSAIETTLKQSWNVSHRLRLSHRAASRILFDLRLRLGLVANP